MYNYDKHYAGLRKNFVWTDNPAFKFENKSSFAGMHEGTKITTLFTPGRAYTDSTAIRTQVRAALKSGLFPATRSTAGVMLYLVGMLYFQFLFPVLRINFFCSDLKRF